MALPILEVCHSNAFVFLWTTQKFLPDAYSILEWWGIRYRFTLVWEKNTGPKPFNHPYSNAEFVLVGSPKFLDEKDFKAVFRFPTAGHSVKPEGFYALLRRVTPGPRLDIFARRRIAGFQPWGDEAPNTEEEEQVCLNFSTDGSSTLPT